jgi:hypothetical protein
MKKLLFIIFLSGLLPSAFAQNVQVTANAQKVVEVGEQFELSYTTNAEPSNVLVPDMHDFRVLYGPTQSSSSSVQMINGKVTQSSSYVYGYVLQGTKPGKYIIGAAEVTVGGKKYKSNTLEIEVVANSSQQSNASSNQTQASTAKGKNTQDEQVTTDGDVFLRVLTDKKSVVQGEYLTATVKIYSKFQVTNVGNVDLSDAGFFKQEIEIPQAHLVRENVNGQIYYTATLKKFILIPQKSGQLKIDPVTMDCNIQKQVQSRSRGVFDDFFGPTVQNVTLKLKSKPVNLTVKSLPENVPASYNGAVGKFTFSTKIDKTKAKTNEAITIKVTVSGNGNLKLVDAPKITFPPDFDTYDPKVNLSTNASNGGISGSKTFEYLIIPRNAGEFHIGPVAFSYFDVDANQFKTLNSDEFVLNIEKGPETAATTVVSGLAKEDIKFIGKDILFIKTNDFGLSKTNSYFFGSFFFWLLYLIGIIAFGSLIWMRRRLISQNANVALVRNRRADKFASRRLKQASLHLKASEKEQFYEELLKAIWGYLSDKLNIAQSELSRDTARDLLEKRGVEEPVLKLFLEIADSCEYARYAPESTGAALHDDYNKAMELITKLQQKLKAG